MTKRLAVITAGHATVSALSSPSLQAHIFISALFDWLNYSDMCKWVVFIFLPGMWKLKVTRCDPHLLLKLNCSECAVWIIVAMQGFVNRHAVTLPTAQRLQQQEESPCYDPLPPPLWGPFEYSPQNKGNHVPCAGPGQGPALCLWFKGRFWRPIRGLKVPHTDVDNMNTQSFSFAEHLTSLCALWAVLIPSWIIWHQRMSFLQSCDATVSISGLQRKCSLRCT